MNTPNTMSSSQYRQPVVATLRNLALALFFASGLMQPTLAQSAPGPDFTDIVEKADPAVVNIRTIEKVKAGRRPNGQETDPLEMFRWFFGPNAPRTPQPTPRGNPRGGEEELPRGVGSGFFISADGYILTNHHVVDGADEILVTLTDKREFKAKVVGSDERTDVALIKVEGTGFTRLPIGDVGRLRKGEWVIAIGSPFGLESTVTAGVVSAKGRDTGDFLPFIQTDVAVNPGNSGGPLINMRGEVVGINSQIFTRSGGYQGISFAIPIDEAIRVSDQLRSSGKVSRGRLGVYPDDVSKEVAESLGLAKAQGAVITQVEAASPAAKAGIEVGDIVLRIDGKVVDRAADLRRIIGGSKPGSKITLQVWRAGKTRELAVTLGELESERATAGRQPTLPKPPKVDGKPNELGLLVTDLTDARKSELKARNGVEIVEVDGVAARAGLRPGDLILSFNAQEITSAKQFNELVGKSDLRKASAVLVKRGDTVNYIALRPVK
jgi:serine protease Do